MAYANTHDTHDAGASFFTTLAHPFVAFGALMGSLSDALSMAHEANRVVEMSDGALAAKGMTRADAIQAVFTK